MLYILAQWPPAHQKQLITIEASDLADAIKQARHLGIELTADRVQEFRFRDQHQQLYRIFAGLAGIEKLLIAMREATIIE
jgi:hypothetical protein